MHTPILKDAKDAKSATHPGALFGALGALFGVLGALFGALENIARTSPRAVLGRARLISTLAIIRDCDLQTPVCFFLASIEVIVETSLVGRGSSSEEVRFGSFDSRSSSASTVPPEV